MCRAFGISGTVWSWLEAPGNELPHRRFGAAIYGANSFQPVDGVLHGIHISPVSSYRLMRI